MAAFKKKEEKARIIEQSQDIKLSAIIDDLKAKQGLTFDKKKWTEELEHLGQKKEYFNVLALLLSSKIIDGNKINPSKIKEMAFIARKFDERAKANDEMKNLVSNVTPADLIRYAKYQIAHPRRIER